MFLNPGQCYYVTFDSNTTKDEFFLKDGTILSFPTSISIKGNNWQTLDVLFSFETIMLQINGYLDGLTRITPNLNHKPKTTHL